MRRNYPAFTDYSTTDYNPYFCFSISAGACMKPDTFTFDRHLFDLLRQPQHAQFTTRDLRDAYAQYLDPGSFRLSDLRRYVYEQIRRLIRAGWIARDEEHRQRGQVYHLLETPNSLNLVLVGSGFAEISSAAHAAAQATSVIGPTDLYLISRLEQQLKETRLDFLSSMGETERYKQLFEEMPHIKDRIENEYFEARDRSSKLLGHVRALEKTLESLAAA